MHDNDNDCRCRDANSSTTSSNVDDGVDGDDQPTTTTDDDGNRIPTVFNLVYLFSLFSLMQCSLFVFFDLSNL